MKRDRENIELTKTVGPCCSARSIFTGPSSLRFHNEFSSTNKRNTLLTTLHLDLNANLAHRICNQEIIRSIANNFHGFPSFHFLEDINEECSLSNNAPDTAHCEVA